MKGEFYEIFCPSHQNWLLDCVQSLLFRFFSNFPAEKLKCPEETAFVGPQARFFPSHFLSAPLWSVYLIIFILCFSMSGSPCLGALGQCFPPNFWTKILTAVGVCGHSVCFPCLPSLGANRNCPDCQMEGSFLRGAKNYLAEGLFPFFGSWHA